jgi:phosphatidylinositol glycan class O
MAKLFNYVAILFWASISMVFSLILFTNGFFLHRNARTEYSNCSFSHQNLFDFKNPLSIATECLKPRARVILLVVDALKYEFATTFYDGNSVATFHRNKLPIIGKILQNFSNNSKLLKFIADPPTTTMQRLKSITTGTLPTFIDIHDNFAADSIVEDNFINLNMDNGNVFMGDDTWIKLYPNKFLREYAVPSFDVSDLDTVDLEVKNQIFKEIQNTDWSLLIAHILGIDHCGHKHGMHHPEMLRKLNETNFFIQEVIENINKEKKDTILFVVGDHGMTESGDHGGSDLDEIEAAMFIYSTLPLMNINTVLNIETKSIVNQIDIVPTISIILGIPIPFSNIGNLIIEAIPKREYSNIIQFDFNFILHSLWKNVFQVQHFINTYSSENFLSDENKLTELKNMYNELLMKLKFIKNNSDLKDFINISEKYFTTVRKICFELWVQFNPNLMTRGLVLFFCSIFSFFILISGLIGKRMYEVLESSFLTCIFSIFSLSLIINVCLYWLQIIDDYKNTSLFFCSLIPVLSFGILLIQNWDYISMTWFQESRQKKTMISILSRIILITIVFGVFSNSYIIRENIILSYFLITLFFFFMYSVKSKNNIECTDKKNKNYRKANKGMMDVSISPLIIFIICLLIRCSNYFWKQRSEQKQLKNEQTYINFVFGKAGSIVSEDMEIIFVFIAITSLSVYISVMKIWLCDCGNLTGYSPSEIIARFSPAIIVVATSCYWILKLQRNSKLNSALKQHINSLPLVIYALFSNAILLIFFCPLTVFLLPKEKEKINIYQEETLIPKLYKKFKNVLYNKKNETDGNEIPIVYGLGTVYSACFILLSVFLCLIYTLLLGFIITPSVILMNLVCIGLLYINAIDRIQNATNLGRHNFTNTKIFSVVFKVIL